MGQVVTGVCCHSLFLTTKPLLIKLKINFSESSSCKLSFDTMCDLILLSHVKILNALEFVTSKTILRVKKKGMPIVVLCI